MGSRTRLEVTSNTLLSDAAVFVGDAVVLPPSRSIRAPKRASAFSTGSCWPVRARCSQRCSQRAFRVRTAIGSSHFCRKHRSRLPLDPPCSAYFGSSMLTCSSVAKNSEKLASEKSSTKPPPEEGGRLVHRPAENHEPRPAELRLEGELPRRPFGRRQMKPSTVAQTRRIWTQRIFVAFMATNDQQGSPTEGQGRTDGSGAVGCDGVEIG